ncbi:putative alpha/beta hydrolase [Mycobacterium montefiorense]|uniref:putative alpha/beta hydrolase n=1 Tax=Mycobacterium montefiorense TaxID=154654 RepID=UPI0021DEFDCD|nr:alpha/beta hydrolase [Mycobacterium montefiorense]MCV7425466.1 hypothetical protein [Mycobacterium montefiorense]GLE50541.1 hypothetical protein ATCCBAA256_01330 [Mycobacterium montefiorense]
MQLRYISIPQLIAEAGGDPWAINSSLQSGRPAQISDLAQVFHNAGRCTTESSNAFEQARNRFEASWNREHGENPINDSAEVQRAAQQLGAQSLQLPKIGVDLESIAAALAEAQRTGATLISTLESQLQQIDNQLGQALGLEKDPHLSAADRSAVDTLIGLLEQQAIDDTKSTLAQIRSIRSGYSDYLQKSLTTLRTDGYDGAAIQGVDAPESAPRAEDSIPLPAPGTSTDGVNRWWKSLTKEQQGRLIAQHPADLGNLNGIPVVARSQVNMAVMNDDLHRVEHLVNNGVSVNDVLSNPGNYGLSPAEVNRYTNASRSKEGLAKSAEAVDLWNRHPDIFLVRYQPDAFGGEGVAAIAMGNPDTAAHTAILVKGLGSGVYEGTLANPDGVRLYDETTRAAGGKPTSVVMWIGYDAPNNVTDPGLYEPNMARTGGQLLASDVNAFAVTHEGAPTHMTVVGHSYGSTVVSDAAAGYGMHSNDVVLVGSPGTDLAHSAADFHLSPGGHLYVGAASGDAVTWSPGQVTGPGVFGPTLGGLGDDPSVDGYGATRFKAEVPGYTANPIYDHSHYFDNGSESLFSIADVVSGHGDALEHDGMTAPHRGEYGMGDWFDPEALRSATTGHTHSAPTG